MKRWLRQQQVRILSYFFALFNLSTKAYKVTQSLRQKGKPRSIDNEYESVTHSVADADAPAVFQEKVGLTPRAPPTVQVVVTTALSPVAKMSRSPSVFRHRSTHRAFDVLSSISAVDNVHSGGNSTHRLRMDLIYLGRAHNSAVVGKKWYVFVISCLN